MKKITYLIISIIFLTFINACAGYKPLYTTNLQFKIVDYSIQSNKKCSYKFMMGYSGWSPGQLESEIENGDWVIQETSSDFIFNDDGQMWDIAIGSFGVEISNFSAHGGSA